MLFVYRLLYKLGLWIGPVLISLSLFSAWLLQYVFLMESESKGWWSFGYIGWLCLFAFIVASSMSVQSAVEEIMRECAVGSPDLVMSVMSRHGYSFTRSLASLSYNFETDFMEVVELYERTTDAGLSKSRFYWALDICLCWPSVSIYDLVEAIEKYKLHHYEYHLMTEPEFARWLDNQRYGE